MASPVHPSVLDAFVRFSTPLEGDELAPYPDNLNLITCAIGCLIESNGSFALALAVPWYLPDGSRASDAEVIRQLTALKALDLRNYSVKSARVQGATTIRLKPEGVLALVAQRLEQDAAFMLRAFPALASWPADAQLFAFSIAWAEGPGWPAENPNLARVLRLAPPDFLAAILHTPTAGHPGMFDAAAADISTKGNPGIVPRNAQNELALSNAALVVQRGLPIENLYWPGTPLTEATA
jgi:hypothetical protein